MKNNKLLILLGFLLTPMLVNAQWTFDDTFLPDTANTSDLFFEVHGNAVDPDGKVWVQSYFATETIITARDGNNGDPDTLSTRVIYVYNEDGTPASFSPLSVLVWADGTTPNDTLGRFWDPTLNDGAGGYDTRTGRGLEADNDGNMIISAWNVLFKIDYQTGEVLAKAEPGIGSLTEASSDASGNIYVGAVAATDQPIIKYDSNLENPENVITTTSGFSRDFQVSEDGLTIWWAGYTGPGVLKYTKDDEFSGFNAVPDTVLRGIRAESFDIHPKTKHLWVGSGSLNDVPGTPYLPQTWYAFDYASLGTASEEPLDSIRWVAGGRNAEFAQEFDGARPRGLDFNSDGNIAYVGGYNGIDTDVDLQKFTTTQVYTSNEGDISEIPEGFKLGQNYPNPFNPTTNINYTIDQAGLVTLRVYDITGREVATLVNNRKNAGDHTVTFDATNLASGVYIYTLQANGVRLTNRMTLIK